MRILVAFFLCSLLLIIPMHQTFAQEAEAEADTASPYSLATDDQISEAHSFYRQCTNNDTMNARKNCMCAATSYLETRVELGSTASADDIMSANRNTCLIDKDKTAIKDPKNLGLEDVTEKQLKEAESVFQWCEGDHQVKRSIDCECLAAKFLDLRIKRGPIENKMSLVGDITRKTCRNVVGTTGVEYASCMKGTNFQYGNHRPKDYCECYARRWAKLFEEWEGRMDENHKSAFRGLARTHCGKQGSYK